MDTTQDTSKKCLIIYHRVDYDGLFSYTIVRRFFEHRDFIVQGFGYNYHDDVSVIPPFEQFARIVMVDISLPVEMMQKINSSKIRDRFIWIDHHITAIENSVKYGYDNLQGVRLNGTAACVLTYKYYIDNTVPELIQMLGAYDVWDHKSFDWDTEIVPVQCGLRLMYGLDAEKIHDDYNYIIHHVHDIISKGLLLNSYIEDLQKSWCERFAFPVTVNNELKGIAMISPMGGSLLFKSILADYDVAVVVEKSAVKGEYTISMYSETGGPRHDFSCGNYMSANYNGGGHKGAAGGKLTEEQFIKLIAEYKI